VLRIDEGSKNQYVSPNNYVLALADKGLVSEIDNYALYGAMPFRHIVGYKSKEAIAYLSNDSLKVKDGDKIYFLPILEKISILKERESDVIIAIHSDAIIAIISGNKEATNEQLM